MATGKAAKPVKITQLLVFGSTVPPLLWGSREATFLLMLTAITAIAIVVVAVMQEKVAGRCFQAGEACKMASQMFDELLGSPSPSSRINLRQGYNTRNSPTRSGTLSKNKSPLILLFQATSAEL